MAKISQKTKVRYVCSECGYVANAWSGKCPECSSWNTLHEKKMPARNEAIAPTTLELHDNAELVDLAELYESKVDQQTHYFSSQALNDFWSNGIVRGSFTLLAGEPGLGKSTLALQLLRSIVHADSNIQCWYVSGEESNIQFSARAKRLGIPPTIKTLQTSNWSIIRDKITAKKPDFVILDSIQTIYDPEISSSPGNVAQVSALASQLLYLCKSMSISCIIIGHVTKDGSIAGPKTLEHLVDSVLNLEKSNQLGINTLSFSKHRFGSTQQLLLMKMEQTGLEIITNPSLALLENLEHGVGVCYGMTMDRNIPLVVEVQSLVTKPLRDDTTLYGRRETQGVKSSKLNIILAILDKYLHVDLKGSDVYVQANGLPASKDDPNLDLAIMLSILSSYLNRPIADLFPKSSKKGTQQKDIFFARLTLSGSIRKSTSLDELEKAAKKLGFRPNPDIDYSQINSLSHKLISL